MEANSRWVGQVVRFGGIGILGAGTNLVIYWTGLQLGVHYIVCSIIGWFVGLVVVFFLNRRFTFQASGPMLTDFFRTLGVYVVQQVIVACGLALGVEALGWDPMVTYFVVLPVAVAWSFLGLKLYAMRAGR